MVMPCSKPALATGELGSPYSTVLLSSSPLSSATQGQQLYIPDEVRG